jgi:hypothetical protein
MPQYFVLHVLRLKAKYRTFYLHFEAIAIRYDNFCMGS